MRTKGCKKLKNGHLIIVTVAQKKHYFLFNTFCVEKQLQSYRVHLEVDQLPSSEGDNHLSLVHGTSKDRFFTRSLPLVYTLVCSDMTDTIWVHLRGDGDKR